MKRKVHIFKKILPFLGMLVLTLDAKTAFSAASDGIKLCLYTVVPSLFPFFFLSALLNQALTGKQIPFLSVIGKICRIPKGAEGLLLTGLLGGYPVGAKSIQEALDSDVISEKDANRLLGFCNNPGPAFIFGISGALFPSPAIPFLIYLIVILSSIITGILLPGGSNHARHYKQNSNQMPLKNAITASVSVCSWVILFKVLIRFLEKWILWLVPTPLSVFINGILELTNGSIMLSSIEKSADKFLLFTLFLVFGGFCVTLQTGSVTKGLSLRSYLQGKLLQTYIAFTLAMICSLILFPGNIPMPLFLCVFLPLIPLLIMKNFAGKRLFNGV